MKKELIIELFERFENACYLYAAIECWSARELQDILGYAKWDNFLKVIEKAQKSSENAGEIVLHHFAESGKMIALGKGGKRMVDDFALTRLESEDKDVLKAIQKDAKTAKKKKDK